MSEVLLEQPLAEVLNPRNTPELAFQSYEMLGGDGAYREQQKDAFIAGEISQPDLDYPKLDRQGLVTGIQELDRVLSIADHQTDPEVRATVWDSAAYRMAEMYWLLACDDVNHRYRGLPAEQVDLIVENTQELNEQLYGKPEEAITNAILGEVWAQIDDKELVGRAAEIKAELENGTTLEIAGEQIVVGPLSGKDNERLPVIPENLLSELKDKLYEDNADVVAAVHDYWDNTISKRAKKDQVFTPEDMFNVFTAVHELRDPDNVSGVGVVFDPDASALSWETELLSVKVGGKRNPIGEVDKMISKVFHEYIIHGGRAVSGIQTALPVLGTGLYTEADEGENSDYLTFEEGLASMCEESALGKYDGNWRPINIEKSLALALAYEGNNFRQIYETLWRVRALMLANSGQELDEKTIETAKRNSYTSTVRIFRGTPTDMPRVGSTGEPRILTFNKDLAYLKGKLQVIDFWERYSSDPYMINLALRAKFDPLNKRQLNIVEDVFGKN